METRIIKTVKTHLHELFLSNILVPVDYQTLVIHQRDDKELKRNRINPKLSKNYVIEAFGRRILLIKRAMMTNGPKSGSKNHSKNLFSTGIMKI